MNTIKLTGTYNFKITRVNGDVEEFTIKNLVVNAGKAQLALLTGDATAVPFTYIALGSAATAVAGSQTALGTEITTNGLGRALATVSRVTTTSTNDTFQLVYTWTASGTQAVEEIGVFNASSAGTMLSRALTGSLGFVNGDQFQATYKLQFS